MHYETKKGNNDSFLRFLFFFYVPVLLWMGAIFYFSNQPSLKAGFANFYEVIIRKFAHVFEFGILALFFWRLFFIGHNFSKKVSFFLSLIFGVLYAASDEIHQLFVYDRSGNWHDLVVDSLAIILFLLLILFQWAGEKRKRFGFLIFFVLVLEISFILFLAFFSQQKQVSLNFLGSLDIKQKAISAESSQSDQKQNSNKENKEKAAQQAIRQADNSADLKLNEKPNEQIKESDSQDRADNTLLKEVNSGITSSKDSPSGDENSKSAKDPLPEKVLLVAPFTSQAPFSVWDETHEEMCEEASLLMFKYFLENKALTPEIAERELQNLKDYEQKKYGDFYDSDMQQLAEIGKNFFGMSQVKAVYDFNKEDIKNWLAKGKPVIVPTAGRRLGNPHFKAPGPLYHNLLIIGYEGNEFITNDPGTRHGKNYRYNENVLFNAIHDFPGDKEKIEQGRKAMLIYQSAAGEKPTAILQSEGF